MKRNLLHTALIALILTLPLTSYSAQLLDRIIAIVDDGVILQSELQQRIELVTKRLRGQGTPLPPEALMRERILEQLVIETIQLQMAQRLGVRIGDDALNQAIESLARNNNMSLSKFEQMLSQDQGGYAAGREQIRKEMILTRVQQSQVERRVRVTDQEVAVFLESEEGAATGGEEYLVGHVLIAFQESAPDEEVAKAREKAEKARQAILDGQNFQQVAVAYSDGQSALEGGLIGWRKRNALPSIVSNVIPKLEQGEPTSILRTGSGFHIMAYLDKRGGNEKLVDQYAARHILIKPNQIRSQSEAKAIIDDLYQRLEQGESFASLAKEYSEDPVSASADGALGWVTPGEMVPAFEREMLTAELNTYTKPFSSRFGWHILEVTDKRRQDMGPQFLANQARQLIHRKKYDEELANWILEIKGEAYIDIKTNDS